MRLFLIRHAAAVSVGEGPVQDDASRPLTANGRREARRGAEVLREAGESFDRILSSPLMRAAQTAEIHAGVLGYRGLLESWPFLASTGKWRDVLEDVLAALAAEGAASVAVVGHNPDMSDLASRLLQLPDGGFPFRPGLVCALDLPRPSLAEAELRFWVDPLTGRVHRSL